MMMTKIKCELCERLDESVIWEDDKLRVIRVDDPDYPGFLRVIWLDHCSEMSDLAPLDQQHFMQVVFSAEQFVRQFYQPLKINLASLGNYVPHLHWHIIPRWEDDPHFPDPIWADRQREGKKRLDPFGSLQAMQNAFNESFLFE